jgi:hypothetical protein
MIKNFLAVALLTACTASFTFAEDSHDCCAAATKTAASQQKTQCISYANLNLSDEQKTKLDAISADCHKAGCNEQSHARFLKKAKGVLSAEQYAQLEKNCASSMHKGKQS